MIHTGSMRKWLEKTARRGEGRLLFNDTWFQQGHSVSCMTILFQTILQITRSDNRPHIKWALSLVIACGHFDFCHGFVLVYGMYGITYSLHHPRGSGGWGRRREGGRVRFDLYCLMTPGFSKDIQCHVWPSFSKLFCKSPDQTPDHTYSGLSAWWLHSFTDFCHGFVWVCMG